MSHITVVATELRDPDAIKAVARALGIEIVENARVRFFLGHSALCDLVFRLPGLYDLGLKRNERGVYDFVCDQELLDNHCSRGEAGRAIIGQHGNRIKQEYAVQKAMATARRKGQSVVRQQLNDGSVRLVIRGL